MDIRKGLIGYWNINVQTTEQDILRDSSAYDREGDLEGKPDINEDGVTSGFFEFDGEKDHVRLADQFSNFGSEGDFCISAWIRTSEEEKAVWTYGYGNHIWGRFGLYTNMASLYTGSTYLKATSNKALDDDWHHIVASFSRSNEEICFYVDGKEQANVAWDGNIEDEEDGKFHMGVLEGSEIGRSDTWFIGSIDAVRIYNRLLSNKQIQVLHNIRCLRRQKA